MNDNKQTWERPTLTEFDIAERTRVEGNPGDDGIDPAETGGGGTPGS